MSQSSQSILDHIAEMLRFISNTQSFWFTINTSYNHGCHLTNRFCLEPNDYEVVSPLIAPPSCHLDAPAGCRIASRRPLVALPSRSLVVPTGCHIASPCPLVVPPTHPVVVPAGVALPLNTPPSRRLIVSSCRLSLSHHVSWFSHHHLSLFSRCTALLFSCSLIVLAGCWVASPFTTLLSSRRSSPLPTPSNAVERCCRHRTPPPPPPLKAVSIVHHCHSCHPSPPSNDNAHLCPSPPSKADARRHHPPPRMSISIVALSSPFHSPHRCHCQTPTQQMNAIFNVHRH